MKPVEPFYPTGLPGPTLTALTRARVDVRASWTFRAIRYML